jgi:glycosyltransferase involved in cell wall biosynthesis
LATNTQEWAQYMQQYLTDPDLLQAHGKAGYNLVKADYNIEDWAQKLAQLVFSG